MNPCSAPVILIGSVADLHLQAILDRLKPGAVVLDATSVTEVVQDVTPERIWLRDVNGETVVLDRASRARGWIRRLTQDGWDDGVLLGSRQAAGLSAQLTLLGAVVHHPGISWVTAPSQLFAAENKLVQSRAAADAGMRVPSSSVGPDADALEAALGSPFVIKPLGPGGYRDADDTHKVVFARKVTAADLAGVDTRTSPFIAQEYLHAVEHLRVVTVGEQVWVASLNADGRPCDWRSDADAHDAFAPSTTHPDVADSAVHVARLLGCGYTSQDWIIDNAGASFLDLNPGGQWLFLPEPIAGQVSDALARVLAGTG